MKSLNDFRDALLTANLPLSHYFAAKKPDKYLVWAEDGEDSEYADNGRSTFALTGTLDFFTKTENDSALSDVEAALDSCADSWFLNSIQREDTTGYIHYEWIWKAMVEEWPA